MLNRVFWAQHRVLIRSNVSRSLAEFLIVGGFALACIPCCPAASKLAFESRDGYRVASLPAVPAHQPGLTLLSSAETGIAFTNILTEAKMAANANLLNGSGVALGDYDADGLCDMYLCNLNGHNVLYKNLGGWKFRDATSEAGVACTNQINTGAVFADVNGDGFLDLLVTSMGGPNACFINDGKGRFVNTTAQSGLTSKLGSTSMALADIDGNGTLDLYVANYGVNSILKSGGALNMSYDEKGQPVVRGRYAQRIKVVNGIMFELGEPHVLYRNDGNGKFTPVSWTDGHFVDETGQFLKQAPLDQGLSATFHDINRDGYPDLYVCNDAFTPDRFWINDGTGRFRALDPLAWRASSYFSMGADFGDIDRDGWDDLFVVDMQSRRHQYIVTQKGTMAPSLRTLGMLDYRSQMRRNTLFLNRSDGTLAEIANFAGVSASEWSWSGLFLDVDLDGWLDILVTNGFGQNADDLDAKEKIAAMGKLGVEESRRATKLFQPLLTPNVAFHNQRDLTFREVGRDWGFDSSQISHGMALADLDNDGDLDVVVNCFNSPALIYRNEASAPRLGVRLKGVPPNTQAVGARIEVSGGPVQQSAEVTSGGRYCSGDDPMQVFACRDASSSLSIKVTWPDRRVSTLENVRPNSIYELNQSAARRVDPAPSPPRTPLFEDVSTLLQHQHQDPPFDDFKSYPTLPERLSLIGPGAAWGDVNGDGFQDILIGGGEGQKLGIYLNSGGKSFVLMTNSIPTNFEVTAMLYLQRASNQGEILLGHGNYRAPSRQTVTIVSAPTLTVDEIPGDVAVGALAHAEVSGAEYLFVGGRFSPGRYPEPCASKIYRRSNGRWEVLAQTGEPLQNLGSVTGATWADLNSDGKPELSLSCEWGSIRIFEFTDGRLVEKSREWGLANFVGRWQCLAAADLDHDGKVDLLAGNWGLNSFYSQAPERDVYLSYGDINGDGLIHTIEACRDPYLNKVVPWRDMKFFSTTFPWLREKFATHQAYSEASMEEILAGRQDRVKVVHATTMAMTVFMNRGGHFEPEPLPAFAQFSPATGVGISDFNGDGHPDLFLAQNHSGFRDEDGPLNAGRGLLLLGDGKGAFRALSAGESGLKLYGDQRTVAIADFDQDGRKDLLVTQNNGPAKLFRNVRGTPVPPPSR